MLSLKLTDKMRLRHETILDWKWMKQFTGYIKAYQPSNGIHIVLIHHLDYSNFQKITQLIFMMSNTLTR